MSRRVLELRSHFDAKAWQVTPAGEPGRTLLVSWTIEPEPVDAGPPPEVRSVLAAALCSLGSCWFAGDDTAGRPVATLRLQRRLAARGVTVFRADAPRELGAAFESGAHDWSQAAQWIVVAARDHADARAAALIQRLLEGWKLPDGWPAEALAIVQAATDGDAAACHCRTADVERALRVALEQAARSQDFAIERMP